MATQQQKISKQSSQQPVGGGDTQLAEQKLIAEIQKNARNVNALSLLASLYMQRNEIYAALPLLERAVQVSPASPRLNDLGVAYRKIGRPDLAIAAFEKALLLDRNNAAALFNYSGQLKILGELQRAFDSYRRAGDLDERLRIPALAACAAIKEEMGQVDEAFADIMTLIEQGHRNSTVLRTFAFFLSQHKQFSEYIDLGIDLLRAALEQKAISPHEVNSYYFLMGTLYQKKKNYEFAFRSFETGHLHSNRDYNEAFELAVLDQISQSWAVQEKGAIAINNPAKQQLIFIVGMPRSGSTLVEQILAIYPESATLGESNYFSTVLNGFFAKNRGDVANFGVRPLSSEETSAIRSLFMQRAFQTLRPATVVTDKTLHNTMHVGQILQVFPNAKILWTRRDPRDTCISCYTHDFAGAHAYRHDLRTLARYHNKVEQLMAFWQERYPENVYAVCYEELIRNPEVKIRELIDFCGFAWSDAYLSFHQVKRTITTASYNQVTQPLYSSAIGRWKDYEAFIGPLLEELGCTSD